jgi:hypothetical protein
MTKPDILNLQELLQESPWGYPVLPSSFEDKMLDIKGGDIRKEKFVERMDNMDIYFNPDTNGGNYYVLIGDDLASYYQYIQNKNSIKTKMTWNSRKYKGSLRDLLTKFIIPKYKIVESDDVLSNSAFSMWQKMVMEFPKYEFYAKLPSGELSDRITNYHEILLYREPITSQGNSTFIVRYGH